MSETWKPVKGYEQYYLISDLGRVKTIKTGIIRKLQVHKDGYYCLIICVNNVRHIKYIHKLIAEAFIDNPLNYIEVNHIDGNKKNNCISNLEWCTHNENMYHASVTGLITFCRGENINTVKLNESQVIEIRKLKGKVRGNKIAEQYGVNKSTIYDIFHNVTWKHLL